MPKASGKTPNRVVSTRTIVVGTGRNKRTIRVAIVRRHSDSGTPQGKAK